jgi:hypothetical protein
VKHGRKKGGTKGFPRTGWWKKAGGNKGEDKTEKINVWENWDWYVWVQVSEGSKSRGLEKRAAVSFWQGVRLCKDSDVSLELYPEC